MNASLVVVFYFFVVLVLVVEVLVVEGVALDVIVVFLSSLFVLDELEVVEATVFEEDRLDEEAGAIGDEAVEATAEDPLEVLTVVTSVVGPVVWDFQ